MNQKIFFIVEKIDSFIAVRSTLTDKLVLHKRRNSNQYVVRYWRNLESAQSWVKYKNLIANNLLGRRNK